MKKYAFLATVLLICFIGSVAADEIDVVIKQLKSSNTTRRLAAVKELGKRKDPRAVNPLVSVLKSDRKWEVRLAAEDSLVSIGSPSAESLIRLVKEDKDCFVRRRSVRALKEIKDPCASEALIKASSEDADCCVRKFAARALGEINDPKATEFLDDTMKKKNLEIISAAYRYYVRKGEQGTEDVLVEAMQDSSYDKRMVLDLTNCGNEKLKKAADEIAKKRGYRTTPDWPGPKWGKI